MKDYVYLRLREILTGKDDSPDFKEIPPGNQGSNFGNYLQHQTRSAELLENEIVFLLAIHPLEISHKYWNRLALHKK